MSSSKKFSTKNFFILLVYILFLLAAPSFLGYVVLSNQISKLDINVEGQFVPGLAGKFDLKNARIDWDERVELVSGDLHVYFDLISLFSPQPMRFSVSGENLEVRLKGEWEKYQGVSEADLETFYADLGLGKNGIEAIYSVEAFGPKFKFAIRESKSN